MVKTMRNVLTILLLVWLFAQSALAETNGYVVVSYTNTTPLVTYSNEYFRLLLPPGWSVENGETTTNEFSDFSIVESVTNRVLGVHVGPKGKLGKLLCRPDSMVTLTNAKGDKTTDLIFKGERVIRFADGALYSVCISRTSGFDKKNDLLAGAVFDSLESR